VPCLIAADWHMHIPDKNHGPPSPGALFRLIKMDWLTLTDVRRYFDPYDYVALAHYNDKPDERRYPFVVASRNESMPTPSQRVRLRRQAGLATYSDVFFGYDPTGYSDDKGGGDGKGGPPPPRRDPFPPAPVPTEMTSASTSTVVEAEAGESVVVEEEPKPKRRKVKGTTKTRSRAKPKALRRECSRPKV
jgi:hypothetical protein